jgi:BirA family biotin operon repressor/biotin-[acetyl-CoA-carboxylase] ligase
MERETEACDLGVEPDQVLSGHADLGLSTKFIGRNVHYMSSVGSTNATCWELASRGEPEGTVVLAEEQTAGRGRSGRAWFSPRGLGIWASVLVRPSMTTEELAALSIATALAIADGIAEAAGVSVKVKWPNDVIAEGRKLAGVLVESEQIAGSRVESAVVGLGINVNTAVEDFPEDLKGSATSVGLLHGSPVSRIEVLRSVMWEFERYYREYLAGGVAGFKPRWRTLSATLGGCVEIVSGERTIRGKAVDLAPSGALLIENELGITEEVWHGSAVLCDPVPDRVESA